jgi:uncharacterized membrane protein HdeD (DUF308 family)
MMAEGILGVLAGCVVLLVPGVGALALTWIVAGWALVTGVFEIMAAVKLREIMTGEWLLFIAGALSVILGIMVAVFPAIGMLLLVTWVGAYALVYGVITLVLAVRVKRWTRVNA